MAEFIEMTLEKTNMKILERKDSIVRVIEITSGAKIEFSTRPIDYYYVLDSFESIAIRLNGGGEDG